MLSFIKRFALLVSSVAVMALAPPPLAFAATTGGVDTPSGVQNLPLAVEGNAVITLTDNPTNAAAVNGNLSASGTIQLGLFTMGNTCSNKGAIGFDSIQNRPIFCNGTAWLPLGGSLSAGYSSAPTKTSINGLPATYDKITINVSGTDSVLHAHMYSDYSEMGVAHGGSVGGQSAITVDSVNCAVSDTQNPDTLGGPDVFRSTASCVMPLKAGSHTIEFSSRVWGGGAPSVPTSFVQGSYGYDIIPLP